MEAHGVCSAVQLLSLDTMGDPVVSLLLTETVSIACSVLDNSQAIEGRNGDNWKEQSPGVGQTTCWSSWAFLVFPPGHLSIPTLVWPEHHYAHCGSNPLGRSLPANASCTPLPVNFSRELGYVTAALLSLQWLPIATSCKLSWNAISSTDPCLTSPSRTGFSPSPKFS